MNYASLKKIDIANGLGVRVSLFVSGCTHRCKNCFNSVAWDFNYGKPFTKAVEQEIMTALVPDYIAGLSLLGGEPFEPSNQEALLDLVRGVKSCYPTKTIWCYTGYTLEIAGEKLSLGAADCAVTEDFLKNIDVLVDGKYEEDLRDITLKFRGSANQRVIDVGKTLMLKQIVLLDL